MRVVLRVLAIVSLPILAGLALSGCNSSGGSSVSSTGAGSSGQSSAPMQLRRDGRWLVDPYGRVVLLHGVNMVWKVSPYVPPETPEGFTAADAGWLEDHGFNSARIGVLWVGVSPLMPGVIDAGYLTAWDRVVNLLAAHHVWMLFDFHQDLLGEVYQGEGVPEWAVSKIEGSFTSLLGAPTFGFPFNYFTPQVSEAFDNLWKEHGVVWDGFRDAWAAVAGHWKNQAYSMGYDLFNEPWAGLEYPTCLIPLTGCPQHETDELQPIFEHALAGIRSVDRHNIAWFEPQPLVSTGAPATGFGPVAGESQLGYSFHYYCPLNTLANALQLGVLDTLPVGLASTCDSFGSNTFGQARAQADKMGGVELLTEFGATDEVQVIHDVTAQADISLVGWEYWQYKNWLDPTTESQGSGAQSLFTNDADLSTVKMDKLRILERPYPQATAGIPVSLSFDPTSGEFHYSYTPKTLSKPTEIYVPVALHYPQGYHAVVAGAVVTSVAGASPLVLENTPGATSVSVTITRP